MWAEPKHGPLEFNKRPDHLHHHSSGRGCGVDRLRFVVPVRTLHAGPNRVWPEAGVIVRLGEELTLALPRG